MNTGPNEPDMPDLDYSDPDVVIGNIQALETAIVRLLYTLKAKDQLMDGEAEYCLAYSPVAAIQTPHLGSAHDLSYQSSLVRMELLYRILHDTFPIGEK